MQGTAQRLRIDAARGGTEVSGSGAAAPAYHPDAFTGQIPASHRDCYAYAELSHRAFHR